MTFSPVSIRLYDSTDESYHDVEFGEKASIYTCGVTPYDSSHLGHIATFMYFDILRRLLESLGVDVTLVRNVTDLDDPLFERARSTGEDLDELIATNVHTLNRDLKDLNCLEPTHEPFSSEYVDEMIEAIAQLLHSGNAYTVDGWTYFDTSTREEFPEFSSVKKLNEKEIERIGAERGANPDDPRMRNRLDFVLWKPSAEDEPAFDAPFGRGRPGWHIECSVMAMRLLGPTTDIHGGGDDLIFPHHACEVTQSETLSGQRYVRRFMHVAPVAYDGTKMSKSLGNLVYANDVIKDIGARCTRMMILSHHYREGFEHHKEQAREALNRCERWTRVMSDFTGKPEAGLVHKMVTDSLVNDLDTPTALIIIDEAVAAYNAESPSAELQRADIQAAKELLGL